MKSFEMIYHEAICNSYLCRLFVISLVYITFAAVLKWLHITKIEYDEQCKG